MTGKITVFVFVTKIDSFLIVVSLVRNKLIEIHYTTARKVK